MGADRERYRRLPGRRRGILFGSSVWLGSDHLLLVRSARFREEYRRFYFRDIQAIVTANARRFHISTRAVFIAAVWFGVFLGLAGLGYGSGKTGKVLDWASLAIAVGLIAAWVYVSAFRSCRCRIYTAVSSEELPSLYRTWTTRRFLEQVRPHIEKAQGVIEGNWAEAVEDKQIGPLPEGRLGLSTAGGAAESVPPQRPGAMASDPAAVLFVASLCLGGAADLLTLQAGTNVARWILLGFILLQLSAAVAVLVQSYLGKLRRSMRNLAVILLASIGFWYYVVQIGEGMVIGYQSAKSKKPQAVPTQIEPLALLYYPISRGIAGGMDLVLGLAGVVVLLRGERPARERISFNV